jgi:hypothetical protein
MFPRDHAVLLNQRGTELEEAGELKPAIGQYRKAAETDPSWSVPLYNLGLLYKRQLMWKESAEWNHKAVALNPKDEAAWWNLGIAATALRRWKLAREAWRGFGIKNIPEGSGPIELPCGYTPVRLNPESEAEVVWAERLDPARAEIASIPFPESGHRWRDVVLNDGAPVGHRLYRGEEVPVFNALQLFQCSKFGTFIARVRMPVNSAKGERLCQLAAEMEGSAEDWSTSIQILCKACSEGTPHDHHDSERVPPQPPDVRLIGIAARNRKHATQILNAWETEAQAGVKVESLSDDAVSNQ